MKRNLAMAMSVLALILTGSATTGQAADTQAVRSAPANAPVISQKRFSIEYTLSQTADATGLEKVELYVTSDMGRTWQNYGTDPDRQSPFVVAVDSDGVYGFALVSTDRVGNRERPPLPGTYPEQVVIIDTSAPTGKFTAPLTRQPMPEKGVTIGWEAIDTHLSADPVEIHVSGNGGQKWYLVKRGLPSKGRLLWKPPAQRAPTYTFRMKIRDKAGNVAYVSCPGAVVTDDIVPEVKITGPDTPTGHTARITYTASDNPGGSGLDWVDLWITTDGGQNWKKYSRDEDAQSPVVYENTSKAGKVGFALQAADSVGNLSVGPKPGTEPYLELIFDYQGPSISLAEFADGKRLVKGGAQVSIGWSAEDPNMAADSVTVSWSADGGQTWETLATKQPASGSITWDVPRNPDKNLNNCLIRVSAADSLGNESVVESPQPFSILSRAPSVEPVIRIPGPTEDAATEEEVKPLPSAAEAIVQSEEPIAENMDVETQPAEVMVHSEANEALQEVTPATLSRDSEPGKPAHPSALDTEESMGAPVTEDRTIAVVPNEVRAVEEEKQFKEQELIEKMRGEEEQKRQEAAIAKAAEERKQQEAAAEAAAKAEAERTRQEAIAKAAEAERKRQAEAVAKAEAERKRREEAAAAANKTTAQRQQEAAAAKAAEEERTRQASIAKAQDEARKAEAEQAAAKRELEAALTTPGQPAATSPDVSQAPAPNRSQALPLVKQGDIALGDKDITQAEVLYKRALGLEPNIPEAYVGLGRVARERNDIKAALEQAEKAYAVDTGHVPAYLLTGELSLAAAKAAAQHLDSGQKLGADPQDLIRVRERLNLHLRNAEAAYLRVSKIEPKSKKGWDGLGDTYYFKSKVMGDTGEKNAALFDAQKAFQKSYNIDTPNYREAFHLGVIHYRRQEFDASQRYLQRGIEVCPADIQPKECYWYLAEIATRQNRPDDALHYWRKTADAYDAEDPNESRFNKMAREKAQEIEQKLNY